MGTYPVSMLERARREIIEDIASGRFTADDIVEFSDLHDYVDANEYGGLCDDDCPIPHSEDGFAAANALQNDIDEWIRSGGLHSAVTA